MQSLVSVFTPAHRTEWLDRLYLSLREQTYRDWEWVVAPNGEKRDAIIKILHDFGDGRIKIVPSPDGPPNVGRLKKWCCEQATGDLLVEVDSDDWLARTAIEKIRDTHLQTGAGFIFSNCVCPTPDGGVDMYSRDYGWEYGEHTHNGVNYLVMNNFAVEPRTLAEVYYSPNHVRAWSADAYHAAGGHDPDMRICDDQDLVCRTYLTGTPFASIDDVLYYQPRHDGATSIQLWQDIANKNLEVRDRYLHRLIFEWCRREKLLMIDLGGDHNAPKGFKTLDRNNNSGVVDYVADVRDLDGVLENNSVGCFRACDFLEHIASTSVPGVMNALYDKLVDGGWLITETPSVRGPNGEVGCGAFQDPTHVSFWSENNWWYYTNRNLAKYVPEIRCRFQDVRLFTGYPSDGHRANFIPYVYADVMAMKGKRHAGMAKI